MYFWKKNWVFPQTVVVRQCKKNKKYMEFILLGILLLTFIPVFIPFRKTLSDIRGLKILTITYMIYLILFLLIVYLALFEDLYFGYGMGDLYTYALLSIAMILANFGIGLRNSIGQEFKYFFSLINILASIYLIYMLSTCNHI